MYVPFFSTENNLQVMRKLKVIFLIKQIRFIDFLILIVWVVPLAINFLFFNLISGKNDVSYVFYPFGSVFNGANDAKFDDWYTWYGAVHFGALIITLIMRVSLGITLFKKMKQYQNKSEHFKWEKKSKFWWVIFCPFVSFVVYSILLKMSRFELVHKYNL